VKKDPAAAQLARVREAGQDAGSASSQRILREVLKGREARAIAKAAAVASEQDVVELRPDLHAALGRLLDAPFKADPGCAAKTALCEALDRLGATELEVFRRATRHVQSEPVFGGRVDTAAELRGRAAMAVARLDPHDGLLDLARLLADPEPATRIQAARALAYRGRADGLALLHLRVHAGDDEPRVLGACFEAALRISPVSSVAFVAGFLDASAAGIAEEAALALGDSRRDEAFEVLRDWCGRTADPVRRQAGLRALALLRREEAFDYLLERVREGTPTAAREALQALAVFGEDASLTACVRAAALPREEAEVVQALRDAFR
jgi:hypothetical protein